MQLVLAVEGLAPDKKQKYKVEGWSIQDKDKPKVIIHMQSI